MAKETKLRGWMDAVGIKIETLAHESGVSYATVRHLYYGTNGGNPNRSTITPILKALDARYEDIF